MKKIIWYPENQYSKNDLVLVGGCLYNLQFTSKKKYFVINEFGKIIYLKEIHSPAVIQCSTGTIFLHSFWEKESEDFKSLKVNTPLSWYFELIYFLFGFIFFTILAFFILYLKLYK